MAIPALTTSLADMREQKTFGAIGACVSRDLGKIIFPDATRESLWRINTISLVDNKPCNFDFQKYISNKQEVFFLGQNLRKNFNLDDFFGNNKYVIIDFFRETYDVLYLSDGSIITKELRLMMNQLVPLLPVTNSIGAYSPNFPDVWLDAMRKLAGIINKTNCVVLICPVFCVTGIRERNIFSNPNNWDSFYVRLCNILMHKMQYIANLLIDRAILLPSVPHFAECDIEHEYGPGIMHLHKQYYTAMVDEMAMNLDSGMYTMKPRKDKSEYLIERFVATWRTEAEHGYSNKPHAS